MMFDLAPRYELEDGQWYRIDRISVPRIEECYIRCVDGSICTQRYMGSEVVETPRYPVTLQTGL